MFIFLDSITFSGKCKDKKRIGAFRSDLLLLVRLVGFCPSCPDYHLLKPLILLNVINLRVVRNIFHISHYFYCKYAIIVVRKEVGVFIKILTKTYKGEKRYYASLVENKRIDGKVVQRVKANLGPVTEEQIPYLKAAYARKKPHLVYDDE